MSFRVFFLLASMLLFSALSSGTALAQSPVEFVIKHLDQLDSDDEVQALRVAVVRVLVKKNQIERVTSLIQGAGATERSALVLAAAVELAKAGKHDLTYKFAEERLPSGSFEDRADSKGAFIGLSPTPDAVSRRISLLRERGALEELDVASAFVVTAKAPEVLSALSQELRAESAEFPFLPLVETYKKAAKAKLPETEYLAALIAARVAELDEDEVEEFYFGGYFEEQSVLGQTLRRRLLSESVDPTRLLQRFFLAEQSSSSLEPEFASRVNALRESDLDTLLKPSTIDSLMLYLGFTGKEVVANKEIESLNEALKLEMEKSRPLMEPAEFKRGEEQVEQLLNQLQVKLAAGLWGRGEKERAMSVALKVVESREEAVSRMAEASMGYLKSYYSLAREVADSNVEVWLSAAISELSDDVAVPYWSGRLKALPPEKRQDILVRLLRNTELTEQTRTRLEEISPSSIEDVVDNGIESALADLEQLNPQDAGWYRVLWSIVTLSDEDLSAIQQRRLEKYCTQHLQRKSE